ncbi:hypothetical protein BB559_003286 [Furculomyces boomerangus]|uniref:Sugar phosphate transporter domain-containing protein n=1 Tax=Furculomyces boomerangus TaxID=61424 RepID=A0A2T9YM57_9FUNG|nr:hypothetical protein BB559_003286 [Furculomyces boomerangus]
MASVPYKLFLVSAMLSTGTLNTILTKMQNRICVDNCSDPNSNNHVMFEQPIWQTLNMFIGEMFCLLVYGMGVLIERYRSQHLTQDYEPIKNNTASYQSISPSRDSTEGQITDNQVPSSSESNQAEIFGPEDIEEPVKLELTGLSTFLMWIPTMCDIVASTLLNLGLIFVSASVYQMLRGSLVIFAGFFSVKFLGHTLGRSQWISLFMIMVGVSIVGISSVVSSGDTSIGGRTREETIFGVCIILLAQVFGAAHIIAEEKVLNHYNLKPLRGVGLEGTFGCITVGLMIPILHYTIGYKNPGGFFDATAGYGQIMGNPSLFRLCIYIMFCISMFNWSGLSITKAISATSRSTIDSTRTMFIWFISLGLGWESFSFLQVIGFAILVYGTFIYNKVVASPF